MPVKKLSGATKGSGKAAKPKKARKTVKREGKPAQDLTELKLPTSRTKPILDLRKYVTFIYGREGVGKTTLVASIPGVLFITAEAGTKGLEVYEWNHENGGTTSWPLFLKAVELLELAPGPFKNIAVDTVDRLYQLCVEYMVEKLGIPALGLDQEGKKDYGASYKAVNKEFIDTFDRIVRAGIGVFLISHMQEITVKTRSGSEYERLASSLPNSPRRAIEGYSDFIWFIDYAKDSEGRELRLIITSGDEIITAKSRKIAGRTIPKYLKLEEEGGYTYIKDAFKGENHGLDPRTLMPSKRSTKSAANMLQDDRVNAKTKPRKRVTRKGG